MTDREKRHEVLDIFHKLQVLVEDTDEDLWAYKFLTDAQNALNNWLEEIEV